MCDHRARRGGRRGLGRISASPLCHCLLPVAVYCVVTGEVHFDSFQIRHIRVSQERTCARHQKQRNESCDRYVASVVREREHVYKLLLSVQIVRQRSRKPRCRGGGNVFRYNYHKRISPLCSFWRPRTIKSST